MRFGFQTLTLSVGLGAMALAGCINGSDTGSPAPDRNELSVSAFFEKRASWFPYKCCATSIAFSSYASNTGWSIDPARPDGIGNNGVTRWSNGVAKNISGYFTKIDLVGNTELWGLTASGSVYKNSDLYSANGGSWTKICDCGATDLGAGGDGTVVIVDGTGIKRYNRANNTWVAVYANNNWLNAVDVDNNGDIYALRFYDLRLYRLRPPYNSPWTAYDLSDGPGMQSLSVGNGKVYMVGSPCDGDGCRLFGWTPAEGLFNLSSGKAHYLHTTVAGKLWSLSPWGYISWSNI